MKLKIQCTACGDFIPLTFKPQIGEFNGMCPNKECQINSCLRIENLPIDTEYSTNNEVKHCEICEKNWVRKHTCKPSLEYLFVQELEKMSVLTVQEKSKT